MNAPKFALCFSPCSSPDDERRCLEWSTEHLVPVQVFRDTGGDGKRPEFERMVAEIAAKRIGGVIVPALVHLCDGGQELANLLADWVGRGLQMVSVHEGIDTRGDGAVALGQWQVLRAVALFVRKKEIKVRVVREGSRIGRKPEVQTEEQAALVSAHFAQHRTAKPRELARALDVNHALAGRWLKRLADAVVLAPVETAPEMVMTLANTNSEVAA